MYECISECSHETHCMRQCWIDHDDCFAGCPCNQECPEGCSNCKSWFCDMMNGIEHEVCANEDDADREPCNHGDQYGCENGGCCWTSYDNNNGETDVPWCHYPKKNISCDEPWCYLINS